MSVDALRLETRDGDERSHLVVLVVVSLLVRIAYLLVKPSAAVSLDVGMWRQTADVILAGGNPYRLQFTNFLPLWPATIGVMAWISQAAGISFVSQLWTLLITAETLLLVVCFSLLRRVVCPRMARNILLVAIACNPAAMFQVTQHGNIDVIFMLWVMLAVAALLRSHEQQEDRSWLAACGWISLGIVTKTSPVILTPLLFAGARRMSRATRIKGLLLLLGPVLLGFLLILPFAPADVWQNVVLYRSVHGYFGISGILSMIEGVEFPVVGQAVRLQSKLFDIGLPVLILLVSARLWRRGWSNSAQIVMLSAMLLLSVLIFGIGFGPQHIYWLLPPLAVSYGYVPDARWRRILTVAWIVVSATYLFEYIVFVAQGGLLHALFPAAEFVYRARLAWSTAADVTLLRLPQFAVFVGIFIEGLFVLHRINVQRELRDAANPAPGSRIRFPFLPRRLDPSARRRRSD